MADYRAMARQYAAKYGLDPDLFEAQIAQESQFNPRARSRAGAMGLGQLMPGTAAELGVRNPWDPAENLDGAARYMRKQFDAFQGDTAKALAAYNAGAGNVQKYGGIPPFRETQDYVRIITSNAAAKRGTGGQGSAPIAASEPPSRPLAVPATGASTDSYITDVMRAAVATPVFDTPDVQPVESTNDGRLFSSNRMAGDVFGPGERAARAQGPNVGALAVQSILGKPASEDRATSTTAPFVTPAVLEDPFSNQSPPRQESDSSVAAAPSSGRFLGIVDLGKRLQSAGLRVREQSAFGPIGGHSHGSLHYQDKAIDVTDWQDPGESERSWKPRKAWLGQQIASILQGSDAEIFSPHNDPKGHGSHIHLGLPSGQISEDAVNRIVNARMESLKRYPLRWAG